MVILLARSFRFKSSERVGAATALKAVSGLGAAVRPQALKIKDPKEMSSRAKSCLEDVRPDLFVT